jgi:hypothetical protein
MARHMLSHALQGLDYLLFQGVRPDCPSLREQSPREVQRPFNGDKFEPKSVLRTKRIRTLGAGIYRGLRVLNASVAKRIVG